MGRPRKSAAVLEAGGAFREHPSRTRKDHQVPPGRPPIPLDLTASERKCWDQIVELCEAARTLTVADGAALHQVATMLSQWHECRKDAIRTGVLDPNTRSGMAASVSLMLKLSPQIGRILNELGLTPRSRTTVAGAVEPEAQNPLDVWMNSRPGSQN